MKTSNDSIDNIPEPAYLTLDEVARRLNITRMQVYRLLASDRIVGSNFGEGNRRAMWRITPADFAKFEKESRPSARSWRAS